ncbi:MAG: type IVB secretion system protein IcmH/DotU [Reinekea sp.]|jgi:type VI secretion system protein ImpK
MDEMDITLDALIVEVCSPIFSYLTPLQTSEEFDSIDDDLREKIEKSFVVLERRCFECQVQPEHIRDIKYAMSAFADEVVLNSSWEKKYHWMSKPLAIEFFGDSSIGQSFFARLDVLREDLDVNFDIVQLYFSVLVLGFQGRYRLTGYEQLQAYMSTLRSEIEKKSGKINRVLADYAAPESHIKSRIAGQQSYWVMAVLLLASVILMTAIYSQKTQAAIADSAQRIELMAGENYLSGIKEEVEQ